VAEYLSRIYYLYGEKALKIIKEKTVLVCGIGGVGSFTAEALARSGIGHIILLDYDVVEESNLNRQLMSSKENIGISKTLALKERLEKVSESEITCIECFVDQGFILPEVDYVAECMDTLSAKAIIAKQCLEKKIPFISAMGSAKRKSSDNLKVTTLDKTRNDPLAKNYRLLCRKEKIDATKIKVVFCDSVPKQEIIEEKQGQTNKQRFPLGSSIFVTGTVGLKVAELIYNDIICRGLKNE